MTRYRRAGAKWRLLVHRMAPKGMSDHAYSIHGYDGLREKYPRVAADGSAHEFPHTEFDELVVGDWIHIEQMDTGFWWMTIAGMVVHVNADRDGRPTRVTVHMPGEWDDPVPGCEYTLNEHPWPDTP